MINLSTEPSLGSMVITRGGAWKYSYILPRGMEFPAGATSVVEVTDRSGAILLQVPGVLGPLMDRFDYVAENLETIRAGSNWELFVTFDDGGGERTYKTRYGRVVRREASFPLRPVVSDIFGGAMLEDPLDRSDIGERWIVKNGQVGMHPQVSPAPVSWAMASRSAEFFFPLTLYDKSAALWYAQSTTDDIELEFGLLYGGAGETTVSICSNYAMTNYAGVIFKDNGFGSQTIQACRGTGPIVSVTYGPEYDEPQETSGRVYKLSYSTELNRITLKRGSSSLLTWADTGNTIVHGMGHRYFGVSFKGSFLSTGPRLFKWKAAA